MIKDPIFIILFLISIEAVVLFLAGHREYKKYFNFLPAVFWIYFLPMLASTFGIIDPKSTIYQQITNHLLPGALLLLLLAVDIKAIARLGKPALVMFFAGSVGIVAGAPVVFLIFKPWIGAEFWSGFGALSASWTGGSANMIAVKEALDVPDTVFPHMVIVDTIVPYMWMGALVGLAGWQKAFDRFNHSDRRILDELTKRASLDSSQKTVNSLPMTIAIFLFAYLGSRLAQSWAVYLPVIKDVISTYAWTIILVSVFGILLSLSPVRKLETYGSTRIGYLILYFVLTTIGAKANISNIGSTLVLIAAGFVLVLIHAVVLLLTARSIKAPMFLVATASQANIGGVASAPIVAEIYQPGLASVGLLLAILGNIIGTYFGIVAAQLCRLLGGI